MKKVIIKKENAEKIMGVFTKAQGRANARVIECFSHLEGIIADIERRCSVGTQMSKKELSFL